MIHFSNNQHGSAIAAAAGFSFNPRDDICISRTGKYHELLGGVIFRDFTKRSVALHVGSFAANWINRDLLWVVFDYAFNQMKVESIFGPVPEHNIKALEFDQHIGFKEVARIPEVFPEGDMIVLRMRRDECKWLGIKPRYLKSNRTGS